MPALIGTGVFWLSFTALRSLAITAGVLIEAAWLWPQTLQAAQPRSRTAWMPAAGTGKRECGRVQLETRIIEICVAARTSEETYAHHLRLIMSRVRSQRPTH
ncbi:DUF2637 domain-containing protein [Nocardia vinacea]|uniref:DUF2637 domain-containing protein n=1 Tax=Nocardia vinacea TaxID=96468 RepID=UPI0002EA44A1|nr:DUF2637 domain-containing protein [Nocardia vinacea]